MSHPENLVLVIVHTTSFDLVSTSLMCLSELSPKQWGIIIYYSIINAAARKAMISILQHLAN